MRFDRLGPQDTRMKRENMNGVIEEVERLARLTVGDGLVMTSGPSGIALALDGNLPRIALIKMSVNTGSYPTYENDRYVFPAQICASPYFDATDPDLAHSQNFLEAPSINVYNLAKCWLFEGDYLFAVQLNGYWWTYNRRRMAATANADIAKGALGSCTTTNSPTVVITDCRARFGATVSGMKLAIWHDGVEWVIGEEECPP